MERLEAVVRGKVQGVMFRAFTARHGYWLGLQGAVRNRPDGTVHVIAEGSRETLERFLDHLRRGPLLARVTDVTVSWSCATGEYPSFAIRYD